MNKQLLIVLVAIVLISPSLTKKTYTGENADQFETCFNVQVGSTKCVEEQNECFADSVCYAAMQWNWITCSLNLCSDFDTYTRNDTSTISLPNVQCQKGCDTRGQPAWDTNSYHLYTQFQQCYYSCYQFLAASTLSNILLLSVSLILALFLLFK